VFLTISNLKEMEMHLIFKIKLMTKKMRKIKTSLRKRKVHAEAADPEALAQLLLTQASAACSTQKSKTVRTINLSSGKAATKFEKKSGKECTVKCTKQETSPRNLETR